MECTGAFQTVIYPLFIGFVDYFCFILFVSLKLTQCYDWNYLLTFLFIIMIFGAFNDLDKYFNEKIDF